MGRLFIIGLLLAGLVLFSGCAKAPSAGKSDAMGLIDMEKAMAAHFLYPTWQKAVSNERATQRLKENHIDMAKAQATLIGQMQELGEAGRVGVARADYAVRMSEAQLLAREKLDVQRRKEKARIDAQLSMKVAAIEEEYRLPLFNLRMRIESIKPLPRSQQASAEEKEGLSLELERLEAQREQKIAAVASEGIELLIAAMSVYEAQADQRLDEYSEQLRKEFSALEDSRQAVSDARLAAIPETFSKTVVSLDKQLTEQRLLSEKIYNRIFDDVHSQVAKLAVQNKFTVVLRNIRVNVKAVDITDQVIANLPQK